MLRRTIKLAIMTATLALVAAAAFSTTVSAQSRSQSGKASNDACVQQWSSSVGSYRIDWTSYYDTNTLTWYYGYVENASNKATAFLEGVDVFATPADLAGAGSTDPQPPVAFVDPWGWNGVTVGAIGFYGPSEVVSSDFPFGLDTYADGHALGSYTLCFSALDNPR